MAKYSVVIPAYNVQNYIAECIKSIQEQTFTDFEVVIVNDGSKDDTEQICRKLIANDSRFTLLSQDNQGPVMTRINGFRNSTAKYVLFVDSDDYIAPNRIEEIDKLIRQDDELELIVASYSVFNEKDNNPILNYFSPGIYDYDRMRKEIFPQLLVAQPHFTFGIKPSLCACCFKREILEKIIMSVPSGITIGEDLCLTYSYLLKCRKIAISNDSGYYYRSNTTSLTHTCNIDQLSETITLFDYINKMSVPTNNWELQTEEYKLFIAWYIIRKVLQANNVTWNDKVNKLDRYCETISINSCIRECRSLPMSIKRRFRYFCIRYRLWKVLCAFV